MRRYPFLQIAAVFIFSVPAVFALNNRSAVSLSGLDTASCTVPDRDNSGSGIYAGTSLGSAAVTVDHTRLERNSWGLAADSGVNLTVRDTVAARNNSIGFWFRNAGASSRLLATVVNAIASENFSVNGDDGGFVAEGGAQVAIRDSTATRNFSTGFRAFQSTTPTEMSLDRCLATQNDQGILAGAGGRHGDCCHRCVQLDCIFQRVERHRCRH